MKKLILLIAFLITCIVNSQNTQFQRYNVETGKVTYKKETKKETIIKTIIFKNWGAVEYIVENKKEFKGKKKKRLVKERTIITKLDKALIYTVDEKEKKIIQVKNYGLVLFKNKNLTEEGKRISKANGGREVDHETILGFDCEVWKLRGTTTVMYRGVPLKSIFRSDVEIATEAKFNITVSDADIALPDYEIINANPWQDTEDTVDYYSTEEGQQEVIEAGEDALDQAKNMTWEDWYELHGGDPQYENLTEEEIKALYNERIHERVENRVNNRVNNRINNRLRNKKKSSIKRHIPKPW